VLPFADTEVMQLRLEEVSRNFADGALCRGSLRPRWLTHHARSCRAGEHHADLAVFARPELNPVQNVWQHLRQTWLFNRVLETYADIVDAS
jgi:hypothetical protein